MRIDNDYPLDSTKIQIYKATPKNIIVFDEGANKVYATTGEKISFFKTSDIAEVKEKVYFQLVNNNVDQCVIFKYKD
jgi:hypothetical protein